MHTPGLLLSAAHGTVLLHVVSMQMLAIQIRETQSIFVLASCSGRLMLLQYQSCACCTVLLLKSVCELNNKTQLLPLYCYIQLAIESGLLPLPAPTKNIHLLRCMYVGGLGEQASA